MTVRHPRTRHPVVDVLKGWRIALGLSQREVAERMGCHTQGELSAWETGQRQPGLPALDRWAGALGLELIIVEALPDVDD